MLRKNIKLIKPHTLSNPQPSQNQLHSCNTPQTINIHNHPLISSLEHQHTNPQLNKNEKLTNRKLSIKDKIIKSHQPLIQSKQTLNQLTFRSTNFDTISKNQIITTHLKPIVSQFNPNNISDDYVYYCINHQYITAQYQIFNGDRYLYYCQYCASKLKSNGFQAKKIKNQYKKTLICLNRNKFFKSQEKQKVVNTQKIQIEQYLEKTNNIIQILHKKTLQLQQKKTKKISTLANTINLLNLQKQDKISKIQAQYQNKKCKLEQDYKKQDKVIESSIIDINKQKNTIYEARQDILNNLNNIDAKVFSDDEFRKIMDIYWSIIKNTQLKDQQFNHNKFINTQQQSHRENKIDQYKDNQKENVNKNQQQKKPQQYRKEIQDDQKKALKIWDKINNRILQSVSEQQSQNMKQSFVDKHYRFD